MTAKTDPLVAVPEPPKRSNQDADASEIVLKSEPSAEASAAVAETDLAAAQEDAAPVKLEATKRKRSTNAAKAAAVGTTKPSRTSTRVTILAQKAAEKAAAEAAAQTTKKASGRRGRPKKAKTEPVAHEESQVAENAALPTESVALQAENDASVAGPSTQVEMKDADEMDDDDHISLSSESESEEDLNKSKKRKKGKQPKPATEKHQRRFRDHASHKTEERIERAIYQRMFLVDRRKFSSTHQEFAVLGSTGLLYKVNIDHVVSCSCPDHQNGNVCKHILFVMLKVLKLPRDDYRVYQAALLSTELTELFKFSERNAVDATVLANTQTRQAYRENHVASSSTDSMIPANIEPAGAVKQRELKEPQDCPICFDAMKPEEQAAGQLDWCRAMCGNNFHAECIGLLRLHDKKANKTTKCAMCRTNWIDRPEPEQTGSKNKKNKVRKNGQYLDFADLQGLKRNRDYSMYSDWTMKYLKKQRGY